MAVITRSTAHRRYLVRRWVRRARGLAGGLLLVIAGFGFWTALLGGLAAAGVVLDKTSGLDPALRPQVLSTWLWVAAVAVSAQYASRTLRAVPRRMVLWLRRFRHTESILAVSTALDHLGHSWRVVTLDDTTARPQGAASGLRVGVSVAGAVNRLVSAAQRLISVAGVWVVRAYLAAWVALVAWTVWQGTPFAVLEALSGDWRQWPAPWEDLAARFLVGSAVALFAALLVLVAVMLVILLAFPMVMFAGSVSEGVRSAEARKRQQVRTLADLTQVSQDVSAGTRAVLAPRLTVVTVDSAIWQDAVHEFARSCNAVLLDVSSASQALLWEIRQLVHRDARVVLVGEEDAVRHLLSLDQGSLVPPSADETALREALDGHEVLTYRTGLWGRVRFQRALFGALEATAPLHLSRVRLRRWAVTCAALVIVTVGLVQIVTTVTTWPWAQLFE
ncbi:MAG: hypothetical protein JNL54_20930 [Kineosporiaceae bacterium]|nr:hypothetical protein [Kineosporiaceae bacterium]